LNHGVGLSLTRCYLSSGLVQQLAELDQVARIDLLPRPLLDPAELFTIAAADLPELEGPSANAPIVGLIDSGVRSAHPLIGPALVGIETLTPEFADGEDESGHGTRVGGLILHGPLDILVERGLGPRPFCRLLSVRVLDHEHKFPSDVLWEHELEEAIRYCSSQGASIVNLSVGDSSTIYQVPRATPVAALLDALARELQLVIVVSAGNVLPIQYAEPTLESIDHYPLSLRQHPDAALIDPAPAALALTVGSLVGPAAAGGLSSRETVSVRPLGTEGWPSPFSRHGPGIRGAIKPELSHRGGSIGYRPDHAAFADDPELMVVSAGGGNVNARDRLLETSCGTSLATALVTRVAAAVAARHPEAGPNLIRTLVLQSAAPPTFEGEVRGGTLGERREFVLDLVGYGSPGLREAIASSEHRVVLVAEGAIPVDGVHIYEVPIPSSFFESGGTREIAVALSYDPPTRGRRLDYLGSRMEFRLVRGIDIALLERLVIASPEGLGDLTEEEGEEVSEGTIEDSPQPSRLSDLARRHLVPLQPSARRRSVGANQFGRKVFSQRLDPSAGDSFYLVVKNTNTWVPARSQQNYGVAVALSRDIQHPPIYVELEARLQVEVEVELQR
jgi:subtilase family protein